MHAEVTIYTTKFCPFCIRAKSLLDKKAVSYKEIPVDGNRPLRDEMTQKAGSHTVPQIWINQQHVGGCSELMALDAAGKLDAMLAKSPEEL